ncbi:IS3 family transposase [Achromobacter aegrifaciens]
MAKYDEQFKLETVQQCLEGQISGEAVARTRGLDHSMVRRWVSAYQVHGVAGLSKQYVRYSATFKLGVLERIAREGLSDRQALTIYNLRDASIIGRWRRRYDAGGVGALTPKRQGRSAMPHKHPPAPVSKDMTEKQLREENAYLRAENDYLKKLDALPSGTDRSASQKAQVVQGLRHRHPLSLLLRAAELSRSTFYYQMKAQGAADKYAALKARIGAVYARHKGRYGYRRITADLRHTGLIVNHKMIQRLMHMLGLKSLVRPKKYRSYKGTVGRIAPNVLQREFNASSLNEKWVTDVTEFNISGEKLYLSPVMDLYNGEIVAFETSKRPAFSMIGTMLKKAFARLGSTDKPMLHSDQGWVYQMPLYRRLLADRGLMQSMSRKANCLDNAAMESFFGTLKSEFFYLNKFANIDELQKGIKQYIHYYNHDRIKLKLKGLSPVQYRTQPTPT